MAKKVYVFQELFDGPKHYFASEEEAKRVAGRYDPVPPVEVEDMAVFEVGKYYGDYHDFMDEPYGGYNCVFKCVGRSEKFVSFQERHVKWQDGEDVEVLGEKFRVKLREDVYNGAERVSFCHYFHSFNAKACFEVE